MLNIQTSQAGPTFERNNPSKRALLLFL